jgi:hypothetical protein
MGQGSCQTVLVIGKNCTPKPCTVAVHGNEVVVVGANGGKATWTRYAP